MKLSDKELSEIYLGTYDRLIKFARRILDANLEEAEDLVGTIWSRLIDRNSSDGWSIDERGPMPYLFRALKNAKIDLNRSKKEESIDDLGSLEESLSDRERPYLHNPEEECLRREREGIVREILERLNPKYRLVIVSRLLDDLPYKEIRERFNVLESTAHSRLAKGKEEFREEYEKATR